MNARCAGWNRYGTVTVFEEWILSLPLVVKHKTRFLDLEGLLSPIVLIGCARARLMM